MPSPGKELVSRFVPRSSSLLPTMSIFAFCQAHPALPDAATFTGTEEYLAVSA
jgi:hypothetical protein